MHAGQPDQNIHQQFNADNVYMNGNGGNDKTTCRCSLPARAPFFGRERELERIAEALHPDSRSWGVLIDGPGGIGKTALAVEAGHRASEADFCHKLFLSAKVRELLPQGEQPLEDFMLANYMDLLKDLARELGEDGLERLPENERAKVLASRLTDSRALLVIDNLESFDAREQTRVFQFLDRLPLGCKAMVTSRRRSDLRGGVPIRLDRLQQDAALALLDNLAHHYPRLAKADAAAREQLYVATNGNPLLIYWTVGQLGRGHCRTLADACAFLNNAPPDNDPLEYIFGDLLDTFSDNESAALGALVHFRDFAEVRWIAELAQVAETPILTALEDLAERALLIADAKQEKFFLPPLAARFIKNKRPEAVRQSGARLEDAVVALAQENGYEEHECFPQLAEAWPAIAAALPRLVEGDNQRLQSLCDALYLFLEFSGRWDEWLWLSQEAEAKALGARDWDKAGRRVFQSGWVYYLRGQAEAVLACAARAAQHWQKAKAGARERAIAIQLRGLGHQLQKDWPAAINDYREALELHRVRAPESEDVASALNTLANAEKDAGDHAAARRDYREALRIAKKVDYREGVAVYTGNLAELDLARENWAEAEQGAREALGLAEAVGREEMIARDCWVLASALARQDRAEEGLPHARRAVAIYRRLGIRPEEMEKAQAALAACEAGVATTKEV